MLKKLITSVALFFSMKKETKQKPSTICRSKGFICENSGGCMSSCSDAWDNRWLGASEEHVKRASQADDDALQDALGLPRKQHKE